MILQNTFYYGVFEYTKNSGNWYIGKHINKLLKKHGITNTSYGIIIFIKDRRDHQTTIKCKSESGSHLLTVTGKMHKQEFRIYDDVSHELILNILKQNLGEQFRILQRGYEKNSVFSYADLECT